MANPKIPMLDLSQEVEELWDELQAAIQGVLRSGHFIMGPNVRAFEQEVASYLGVKHAIGVNSGTDALVIALRASGVGPGDEVITTAFTFFATAEAISQVGATPVFVDIDPTTFNLDPTLVEARITPRTKAILPVHLYGQAADMGALLELAERHQLLVVEDVAQAFGGEYRGKKVGTLGHVGAFSFFPSKNLGAYGDGGLIATDDDRIADMARMLRVHGSRRKYYNEEIGYNSRLDEIQAAILRVKLPHVNKANHQRRIAAERYNEFLRDVPGVICPHEAPDTLHVFHQYTIRVLGGMRDQVQLRMAEAGIASTVYYPAPLHKLPVYQKMNFCLPLCEQAAREVLSLPIWPDVPEEVQLKVAATLRLALTAP